MTCIKDKSLKRTEYNKVRAAGNNYSGSFGAGLSLYWGAYRLVSRGQIINVISVSALPHVRVVIIKRRGNVAADTETRYLQRAR